MDYDFGDYYTGPDESSKMAASSSSWNFEAESRRQMPIKKGADQVDGKSYSINQPVLAENEQLLTSTLEELGDAVAWYVSDFRILFSLLVCQCI